MVKRMNRVAEALAEALATSWQKEEAMMRIVHRCGTWESLYAIKATVVGALTIA
jgi:hypothetical protein